ncbi:MAG: CHAT domain-containing protein [Chloroflexota bacterium]
MHRQNYANVLPIWNKPGLVMHLILLLTILPPVYAYAAPTSKTDPSVQCQEGIQLAEEGQGEAALPLLEASIAIVDPATFDDADLLIACASTFGSLLWQDSEIDEAIAAYQFALQVSELYQNDRSILTALNDIGPLYIEQGQYTVALDIFQRAQDLARQLDDLPGEMVALSNMYLIFLQQNQWQRAMEMTQRMQQIGQEINQTTGDPIYEGIGMLFTMQALATQWRCTEAHDVGEQALALAGDDERFNVVGTVFFQNAQCAFIDERYDEALELYEQVLDINRARGEYNDEIVVLDGMATIYRRQQRYTEALDVLQQALQRARAIEDRSLEETILGSIGWVYHDQKQYQDALDAYQQALHIAREQQDRFDEATGLLLIGETYREQQRYEEAMATHQQALQIAREMHFRDLEGIALTYLGDDYEAQQQFDQALDMRLQALDVFDTVRTTAGSEAARIGLVEQNFFAYDRPIWLAHQLDQDDLAFAITERGRARSFLDSLATNTIELSDDGANELFQHERETAIVLQQAKEALNEVRLQEDSVLLDRRKAHLAEAEAAHSSAQQAIIEHDDQLADLIPQRTQAPITRADVQRLLPPETTLVSYWMGFDRSLAFVISPDQSHTIELSPTLKEIEQYISQLRSVLIEAPPGQKQRESEAAVWLHEQLIAPIQPYVHTSGLAIIPHASLHYLPFAALSDSNGNMLVDTFTLALLPSASMLRFLQHTTPVTTNTPQALVLANPDYTLPNAIDEAEQIISLFDGSALIGDQATKESLHEHAEEADIVHFATHGTYIPDAPLASYLTLASDSPNTTEATAYGTGSNDTTHLDVADVYALDLQQANLVVLSACESNLGPQTSGDDLVGLTRAFFYAGTPTVVASLWLVPDDATTQLMTYFYSHLRAGAGKAEALQRAQQDLRDVYPSPYYWAGFVLVGDGTSALVAAPWWHRVPWVWLIGLLVGVFLLVSGYIWWRNSKHINTLS